MQKINYIFGKLYASLTIFQFFQASRYLLRLLNHNIRCLNTSATRIFNRTQSNFCLNHHQIPSFIHQSKRYCHSKDVPVDGGSTTVGQVEVKMNLMYTCKGCQTHNSHLISRQSYEKGVVIVTCQGCNSRHLIADNLNWFEDIKEKNIEEILAKKGEVVLKVKAVPDSTREYSE